PSCSRHAPVTNTGGKILLDHVRADHDHRRMLPRFPEYGKTPSPPTGKPVGCRHSAQSGQASTSVTAQSRTPPPRHVSRLALATMRLLTSRASHVGSSPRTAESS